jgi:hypothetical protein
MGRRRCHCRQYLKEGRECPLADRAVVGSNVQKRGGHMSVRVGRWVGLWLGFPRDTNVSDDNEIGDSGNSQDHNSNSMKILTMAMKTMAMKTMATRQSSENGKLCCDYNYK